jgi:hypothetical protein
MTTAYRFSGAVQFLIPDGTAVEATCEAGFRGGRWTGYVTLHDTDRSLERGDVCQTAIQGEDLRIIVTEVQKNRRYGFIALIKPDPAERL